MNHILIRRIIVHAFFALALLSTAPFSARAGESAGGMGAFLGEGIDFKGGMLDWEEDDDGRRVAILRNYAVVILPNVTISARNMVLNVELQEIYAEGDVLFDEPSGNAFYCDQLTFNYQEWKGLAKNIRVKMDRTDVELPVQDFLDVAPSTGLSGSSGGTSLNDAGGGELKRMYVQAQELRVHDHETFEMIDAKITPSSFAKPHWYFRSPAALFRRKEKIESYHNTVNIGRVPVLYFPYLIRDLQYDWPWMRITGGNSSDYGFFVRTQWGWRLNRNENAYLRTDKVIFDLDYFTRRGTGIGVETTYQMGHWESLGKLKLYGVYEHAISQKRDRDRSIFDNEDRIYDGIPGWRGTSYRRDFRWAVDWEHYQQLNEYWDVRAEAHLYHDRDYLKDYDPNRYWNQRESQNSIDVRRLDRQWELEFVAEHRLGNRWETQSAYYPEVRLTVPGIQLFENLPLYLKNDFRAGFVNRYFDEDELAWTRETEEGLFGRDPLTGLSNSRLLDRDNYSTMFRAFNEMRLEAPIKLGFMTIKPWVGLRTAYYSDTIGDPYSEAYIAGGGAGTAARDAYRRGLFHPDQMRTRGSGETNYAVPFGVELSTRAYTIFGNHDQWRLITEPVASYLENSKPRLDSLRSLYPIDYMDEYQRQRRLGFELHNKLQRRYYEDAPGDAIPERDILDFNIAFYNYPRKEDRRWINNDHSLSEINMEMIYRPTANLSFNASVEYEPHDSTFNRVILGMDWRLSGMFRVRATHYHYSGNDWRYPTEQTSSQTHVAVRTKLWNDNSRYSLEGAVGFEWRHAENPLPWARWVRERDQVRHGFNKYRVTIYRDIDTFELALSYIRDRNARDHGLFFSLSPKSFMGVDRPPPTYTVDVETLADGRYPEAVRYMGSGYKIDGPAADADLKDVQF